MDEPLTYAAAGVSYDALDAFKRAAQAAAATTTSLLAAHGFSEANDTRGDSAYLLETDDRFLAHVEEGLGTKNLVADAMATLTGQSYYRGIGIDTVATIVNDLVTCGALPLSVAMHAAVGDGAWFEHQTRAADLALGFAVGCTLAGAVWGGGETPALRGLVERDAIVLAGSAIGQIKPKSLRITGQIRDGDAIVFLASSGVQTNGLTLCRKLAERLPQGWSTPVPGGPCYGEAVLAPSMIYVKFVQAAQQAGLRLNYAVHMTGHGWRKLMRAVEPFVYEVSPARHIPAVFPFIETHAGLDATEMYGTFNMGVGFAAFVNDLDAARCVEIATAAGYDAWVGGVVRREGSRKTVQIKDVGVTFEADSLQVR